MYEFRIEILRDDRCLIPNFQELRVNPSDIQSYRNYKVRKTLRRVTGLSKIDRIRETMYTKHRISIDNVSMIICCGIETASCGI